ncbi:MAG TPA: thioredoxin domain-containing protein [Thermoanaerobaculia bacterium]|nr:thioredoxin domain-containing protein [Thermoanaerobaculia bacterium]
MKKALSLAVLLAVSAVSTAAAATPPLIKEEVDKLVASFLPPCPDPVKISSEPLGVTLGSGLRASVVRIDSANGWCATQVLALATSSKTYFLGVPWVLAGLSGTPAEKIRQFAWTRMNDSVEAKVAMAPRKDGFLPVVVEEKTEFGRIKMSGVVDMAGTIFIPGDVRSLTANGAQLRLDALKAIAGKAPYKGPATAKVIVYEFSDFQCPACKRSADLGDKIAKEFGEKVRFVRLDLPLMGNHPWAFPAALMARAIWKQNPEAFWTFKREVYENQENLDAFKIDDFARGFAKANGLDVARFDADVQSAALKEEILASISAARSVQVNGTPSYLVDGVAVIPGENGRQLLEAIRAKVAAAR